MKIFVTLYEHEYGSDHTAHKTMAGAQARKDEIGNEWWEREFGDTPRPEGSVGDAYFDRIDGEYFSIEEVELER
jgi:hypothetical protein